MKGKLMKVGLVGIGHVGLPTAAALAHVGHEVVAMDSDDEKIAQLDEGTMPFYEPGMEELVRACVEAGRLSFTSDMKQVTQGAEVVFICVGTPPRATGEANLLAIEQAAQSVAEQASNPFVLVQKSTVPAGTATRLLDAMSRYRSEVSFSVVANPEFLREGSAIEDSLHPARILVGSDTPAALDVMKALYQPYIDGGAHWIATDVRTAELAKHACNAFLSMKISFANAMARLCELADADVVAVAEAMGSDDRIGRAFLGAGLGYGGYCFPKDLSAFGALANRLGYEFSLLREIARINDEAVTSTYRKIEEAMWNLEEKRIALLGLAFKAGTDDTRFSPSLSLAKMLLESGAQVVGYDPQANTNAKHDVPGLEVAPDAYEALQGAHCAVVATEWPEFRDLDFQRVHDVMAFPIVVDARNLLDGRSIADAGFTYIPTGRPVLRPPHHQAERS
jgi:UDPglucose 6-dehydrogenase